MFGKIHCFAVYIEETPILNFSLILIGHFIKFFRILAFEVCHRADADISQILGNAFAYARNS